MWKGSHGSAENQWLVKSLLFQSKAVYCWAFIFTGKAGHPWAMLLHFAACVPHGAELKKVFDADLVT